MSTACPGCASRIRFTSNEPAVRCPFCRTSYVLAWKAQVSTLSIPDALADPKEMLEALAPQIRRAATRARAVRTTGLYPHQRAREAAPLQLVSDVAFLAPYWHRSGRLYEAVLGFSANGTARRLAVHHPVELSRKAFDARFPLPEMGKYSFPGDLLVSDRRPPVPILPVVSDPVVLEAEARRMARTHLCRDVEPVIRDARVWITRTHVVLRPFHLVEVDDGGVHVYALVDAASRGLASLLYREQAKKLAEALGAHPLPFDTTLSLFPIRCPSCNAASPLEAEGQVRFCPGCRRAHRVDGERLTPIPHRVELPAEAPSRREFLPVWRFPFHLDDPRDGHPINSIGRLRQLLGDPPTPPEEDETELDVPAYRIDDRRRILPATRPLHVVERRPEPQLVDGPVRPEAGFPDPGRTVAVLSNEAEFIARHVLLLRIPERLLQAASPRRIKNLVFDAPLRLGRPALVLRAFRKGDLVR